MSPSFLEPLLSLVSRTPHLLVSKEVQVLHVQHCMHDLSPTSDPLGTTYLVKQTENVGSILNTSLAYAVYPTHQQVMPIFLPYQY